jgi:hypothetical protein
MGWALWGQWCPLSTHLGGFLSPAHKFCEIGMNHDMLWTWQMQEICCAMRITYIAYAGVAVSGTAYIVLKCTFAQTNLRA